MFEPPGALPGPLLVFIHGGGWTIGSLETHDRLMREYAARTRCRLLGVDYALSPEVRYPVALHQCCDVVASAMSGRAGRASAEVVLIGDSAGANLALGCCLLLRDRGERPPRAALLAYGAFDPSCASDSYRIYGDAGLILTAERMRFFWRNYLGSENPPSSYAAPALADLSGLPPIFMTVAEHDILRDENVALGSRVEANGNGSRTRLYQGTTHAFLEAVAMATVSEMSLQDQVAWLKERLALFASGEFSDPGGLPLR